MIRTTALGSIYLLMLLAVAAGATALSRGTCSDWLTACPADGLELRQPHAGGGGAERRISPDHSDRS